MREKSKNDHFSVEKSETIHKYCPAALETASGIKLVCHQFGDLPSIPSFLEIYLQCSYFLRFHILSCSATHEATRTFTCGEGKLCSIAKKSTSVSPMIVDIS